MWWKSAVNRSFFLCLAACRTRSSAWDTLSRFCARRVLCCPVFPSVPALGSTGSAPGCPALFVSFTATMAGSDFSASVHHRLRLLAFPMRTRCDTPGRAGDLPVPGKERPCMPGSPTTPDRRRLALTPPPVLPSAYSNASAPGTISPFAAQWLACTLPCRRFAGHPRGCRRTARGRCGSLLLHRSGLSPPTPCRSPGALLSAKSGGWGKGGEGGHPCLGAR